MDRLTTIARTAMRGTMARQAAVANNLANVNTSGFRAEIANASTRWVGGGAFQSRAEQVGQVIAADMKAGTAVQTGNTLDIAVDGEALIAVQANDGSEAYTRRGDLRLNESGLLTTGDGYPVLGEGGPITLPPADSVNIAKDGSIWIVPQGGQIDQPQQVDVIKLVNAKGSTIAKSTDTLFREVNGGALPQDPMATVTSGALEGSNVNATTALVQMIEASRAWENQIKMIDTAKEIDSGGASLMRLD
ncbi:flagellar basal-body rod protein FlgF [Sphingobium sp. B2D3A]|uniref:flagellar basal-body rod protein FlgF n=1 Tax=Sphingobium TaxID=165695 RepID=UPI0015EB518D|nr:MULTISPECIES: flagellar basal-body rod protein FlgF [Sphingobium]MCW2337711.1 flagellar basal-body rod protein FlgF [Sphingobium sp. B2D3A]MCW2362074.1 flagellar basal-body rod protein FlgF [Sphingobium sp. B10D3B]MCW2384169.1 flagellar basal-body rod protein FlgF [Sphingobium sp. B2D3D]MCW2401247.1 flagellar basal-body rod protein FlgF [Sphingobium sp. B10D7B]MCW2408227.1 flagellar basal-body rod protein FlgF [Sphingobium xanthum]